MRKKPNPSLGDVPEDLPVCDGACYPSGGGLCCPDDPLELVLHFLAAPAPAPHQVSLAALGIGGSPRRHEETGAGWGQEKDATAPTAAAAGGGGGVFERDCCGLSLRVPEDLEALDELDIEKYFADNAPDGGGEATTVCNQPSHTAAMPSRGVRGALGGVVSNGTPPLLPPMSMDAPQPYAAPHLPPHMSRGVLHPYDAPPRTPPVSAGVLNPYTCRAFGGVPSTDAPTLPAPMPAGRGLQPWGAPLGVVSNAPPLPAPMPAGGGLHPCGALVPVVSGDAPVSRAHTPPSPRTLPASSTSWGSTTSETESPASSWQPLRWVVLRERRRSQVNCRKRPWSLDFPLHALTVAPPDHPSDIIGVVDGKNSCNNAGGGGIRRRRPVPRQRNRQAQRVCSHCHSPETPQWRAGPDGPGTLCNACGIRYAANKLLPEYRPSTAPSFRSDQHSNRHRKVVKLREQKAKETLKAVPDQVPVPVPASPNSDEFMDVCTYISTDL